MNYCCWGWPTRLSGYIEAIQECPLSSRETGQETPIPLLTCDLDGQKKKQEIFYPPQPRFRRLVQTHRGKTKKKNGTIRRGRKTVQGFLPAEGKGLPSGKKRPRGKEKVDFMRGVVPSAVGLVEDLPR